MKTRRHAAILKLVREHEIGSQQALQRLLEREGIHHVTQATLSRDIHELGLVKVAGPDGAAYAIPAGAGVQAPPPAFEQLVRTLLVDIDGVKNLLVLRTPAGSANALASALDREGWREIVGTVAGDDTLLIIVRSERACRTLAARLRRLADRPR